MAATRELRSVYNAARPVTKPAPIRGKVIRRRAGWAVAMLAAAAMLAISVVARRTPSVDLHGGHWVEVSDTVSMPIAVDVPDGHNAIVFATRNPLVDVVWIY